MHPTSNKNQELITNMKKRTKLMTENSDNQNKLNVDLTARPINIPIEENSIINNNTLNNNIHHIIKQNQKEENINNNLDDFEQQNYGASYTENIKEVFDKSPNLEIEILNSFILPKGKVIKIDPLGMTENSLRRKKDGFTYFGYEENDNEIDFLIKPKDENFENKFIGRHFQIRFNPEDLNYYIMDCGFGFGTFMKLINEVQIKDNFLINIGNSYIVCAFEYDDNVFNSQPNEKLLNLKVFTGDTKSSNAIFNSDEQKLILIGRDSYCDVIIEDSLLSRIHCSIIYKDDVGWVIKDGRVSEDNKSERPSTNGTWLFLINETLIFDGIIFKANQSLFRCNYKNKN